MYLVLFGAVIGCDDKTSGCTWKKISSFESYFNDNLLVVVALEDGALNFIDKYFLLYPILPVPFRNLGILPGIKQIYDKMMHPTWCTFFGEAWKYIFHAITKVLPRVAKWEICYTLTSNFNFLWRYSWNTKKKFTQIHAFTTAITKLFNPLMELCMIIHFTFTQKAALSLTTYLFQLHYLSLSLSIAQFLTVWLLQSNTMAPWFEYEANN
jgi:hypothetical protein